MGIPLSTTTITVLSTDTVQDDEEPYSGRTSADLTVKATGVRAVIDRGGGREQLAGGEQTISDFELVCDLCPLTRLDTVRDEATGTEYRVVWLITFTGEHIEAGLRLVEGET